MRASDTNRSRSSAPYRRIAAALQDEIRQQHRPGDKLPSEQAMADRFRVNRHTLRRAVDELVRGGWVQRRWGVGIFVVAQASAMSSDHSARLTKRLESFGKTAHLRVIAQKEIPAPPYIAGELGYDAGEPLIQVAAVPENEIHPSFICTHYLSANRFYDFGMRCDGTPVHACLEACFGVKAVLTRCLISMEVPNTEVARRLGLCDGQPVLLVQSIFTDVKRGEPVDFVRTRIRADRVQLEICWHHHPPSSYTHF